MKKRFFITTNVLLSVILIAVFVFSPLTVSAAEVATPIINEDEIWRGSWISPQTSTVIFKPTKSGFYSLNITDYNNTSNIFIEITDLTTDEPFDYVYKNVTNEPYKCEKRYMAQGHSYELVCYYSGDDLYDVPQADISLKFETVNFTPYPLPECAITSSKTVINFEEGVKDWLKFTPSMTGDYSLNFSESVEGYVEVYNAKSGEIVDARYTFFSEITTGMYLPSQSLVFKLAKNTEYYFCIESYRASSTKISISKNDKDIKSVALGSAIYDIYSIWEPSTISAALFDHIITYTDGTKSTISYIEAMFFGIQLPYVEYLGKTVFVDDFVWLEGGKQPIVSIYGDNVTVMYIDVMPLTDILISEDFAIIGEYEHLDTSFEDYDEFTNYWCVKISETGVYKMDFNRLPDNILEYYSLEIIDENNNVVKPIGQYSWPLVAGHNYAVYFKYCYSEDKPTYDINMYLYRDTYLPIYSDTATNSWYYDAVTYVTGRGIMSGYGGTTKFGAADNVQRQDFLVMLARFDGVDLTEYESQKSAFFDVPEGCYYEAAVNWGYENGIVSGYQNGKFGTGDKITREQLVKFLYNYATYRCLDTTYSSSAKSETKGRYNDYNQISDWALDSVLWAIEKHIISGKNPKAIVPAGNALRCEVAQIMYNIFKNDVF